MQSLYTSALLLHTLLSPSVADKHVVSSYGRAGCMMTASAPRVQALWRQAVFQTSRHPYLSPSIAGVME